MSKQSIIVRKLALAALFASMGVLLKIFSITTAGFRLALFDSVLIFSGMVLGPLYGLAVGFIVDILEYFILQRGFPFSFMILSGTMLTGFIPGLIFLSHRNKEKVPYVRIILSVILATTTAYTINTLYLTGMGFLNTLPARTIALLIKWPLYSVMLPILYQVYLKHSPLKDNRLYVNKNKFEELDV